MGGTPCKVIIIDGNLAYAVTEAIADKYRQANTLLLEAAITASCDGTNFSALYGAIVGYDKPDDEVLDEIIAIHGRIITELPLASKEDVQVLIDELTDKLFAVTRRLYLKEGLDFVPISIESIRDSLEGKKT